MRKMVLTTGSGDISIHAVLFWSLSLITLTVFYFYTSESGSISTHIVFPVIGLWGTAILLLYYGDSHDDLKKHLSSLNKTLQDVTNKNERLETFILKYQDEKEVSRSDALQAQNDIARITLDCQNEKREVKKLKDDLVDFQRKLPTAQKDYESEIRQMSACKDAEIEKLIQSHTDDLDNHHLEQRDQNSRISGELSRLKRDYESKIQRLTSTNEYKVDKAKKQFEMTEKQLNDNHREELERQSKQHRIQIREAHKKYETKIKEIKSRQKDELYKLEMKLKQALDDKEAITKKFHDEQRSSKVAELKLVAGYHEVQMSDQQKASQDQKSEFAKMRERDHLYRAEIDRLRDASNNEKDQIREDYDKKIQALQEKHERDIAQLHRKHGIEIERNSQDRKESEQAIRNDYDKLISTIRNDSEAQAERLCRMHGKAMENQQMAVVASTKQQCELLMDYLDNMSQQGKNAEYLVSLFSLAHYENAKNLGMLVTITFPSIGDNKKHFFQRFQSHHIAPSCRCLKFKTYLQTI